MFNTIKNFFLLSKIGKFFLSIKMFECISGPNSNNLYAVQFLSFTEPVPYLDTIKSTVFPKLMKYLNVVKAKGFLVIKKYFSCQLLLNVTLLNLL